MTLLEVEELTRYWADHPPLHLLLAAHFGKQRGKPAISPGSPVTPAFITRNKTTEQLLAELGPAFVNGDVHAGLGPVLLDVTELRRQIAAQNKQEPAIDPESQLRAVL